jgi:hypothetical protein
MQLKKKTIKKMLQNKRNSNQNNKYQIWYINQIKQKIEEWHKEKSNKKGFKAKQIAIKILRINFDTKTKEHDTF